jgi:hypothetical protein
MGTQMYKKIIMINNNNIIVLIVLSIARVKESVTNHPNPCWRVEKNNNPMMKSTSKASNFLYHFFIFNSLTLEAEKY